MPAHIIPIVEGHGDVAAVPLLIRRIASALGVFDVRVGKPIRSPRQRLVKPGELERAVKLASRKVAGNGQILILIDAEDDCPRDLAPELAVRARTGVTVPVAVVLAKREYEAWFLGSLPSLHTALGLTGPIPAVVDPESIRGAKERFAALMGIHYSETLDQPSLTTQFDMTESRQRCPSFDKCWRAIEELIGTEQAGRADVVL